MYPEVMTALVDTLTVLPIVCHCLQASLQLAVTSAYNPTGVCHLLH